MEYDRDLAFVYRNPTKIVFGEKTASDVGIEVGELGCARAFVVTDPGVVEAGIADRVVKALGEGMRAATIVASRTRGSTSSTRQPLPQGKRAPTAW